MPGKFNNNEQIEDMLKTITSAELVIKEVKDAGVDISESERLLAQAMEAYKENDDKKVRFFVKKAEALAKKVWKDYYVKLTEDTLSSTRKLIDEVKEAGLEPVEAEELFNHAIELVEKKNFKLAEDYIKESVNAANKIWNESRSKIVSDAIASIHALIMEAKEIGVNVSDAEKVLLNAITNYKNEDYEVADELVKKAVIMARDSWNKYRSKVASEGISDMYNLIMKAKQGGTDTKKSEKLLARAEKRFEETAYDEVEDLLKQVETDIKNRMQDARSRELEQQLNRARKAMADAKKMKADVTSAEELFKQAEAMYKERDYDSVDDYLKVIETLIQDAMREVESEIAAESISSTESMLRDIETRVETKPSDGTPSDALTETQKLLEKLKLMGEQDETEKAPAAEPVEAAEVVEDVEIVEEPDEKVAVYETVKGGEQTGEVDTSSDDPESYEWGATYICKEPKSQQSFQFYLNLLKGGARGLCISRMHPDKLAKKFNLTDSTIWLSKLSCDTCRNPSNLGKLAFTINQYLDKNPASIILLDGLEYLINNNDFQMVIRFIDDIHESIVVNDSIFIIPVSPASYTEKELTLLERNSIGLTDRLIKTTSKFFENMPLLLEDEEDASKSGRGPTQDVQSNKGKKKKKK
jgi:tetratricopeptide (TPR) repeat protein